MTIPQASLITLEEAAKYCRVKEERLLGFTKSGHAPYYMIDEEGPFFKKTEIRSWVEENLISRNKGRFLPKAVEVFVPRTRNAIPPDSISSIANLRQLNVSDFRSGIYFLCKGKDVVYVGKSTCVSQRVAGHHMKKEKDFDINAVSFFPVPPCLLDETEREFIRLLKPRCNTTHNRENLDKRLAIARKADIEKLKAAGRRNLGLE